VSGIIATPPVTAAEPPRAATPPGGYHFSVLAGYLGWALDSFDFFLVVYCLTAIAAEFHRKDSDIALAITLTLAFRPLGAILFGLLADRFGRRLPLMVDLLFYSLIEVLTAFAPNYFTFLALRALFGIGLGGEWGVGASLVMEKAPTARRGLVSGLLQQGYAMGNLLAAGCYYFFFDKWGWRPLFFIGGLPALLCLLIRLRVDESEVWQSQKRRTVREILAQLYDHRKLLISMVGLLAALNLAGHSTVDMYPTFLQRKWDLSPTTRSAVSALALTGTLFGALLVGYLSDRIGRRRAMAIAFGLAILIVPVWAFAPTLALTIEAAWIMQFLVQGAWGVIPAHLAELAPNSVRGSLPGFAYQMGALASSGIVYLQALAAERMPYSNAMAITAGSALVLAAIASCLGQERKGRDLAE
jgi:SHS family lactate transporter-like MFS transporter